MTRPEWKKGLSKKQVKDAIKRGRRWSEITGRPSSQKKGPRPKKK